MTTVSIFGGVSKRDIVEQAKEQLGEAGYDFNIEPEEMSSMLRRLNSTMNSWKGRGIDLGYNFPTYGPGDPDDESGIPDDAVEAVVGALARARAPGIGKTLSGEANSAYAGAMAMVTAKYMAPIEMGFGRQTISGSGYPGWYGGAFIQTGATTPIDSTFDDPVDDGDETYLVDG